MPFNSATPSCPSATGAMYKHCLRKMGAEIIQLLNRLLHGLTGSKLAAASASRTRQLSHSKPPAG